MNYLTERIIPLLKAYAFVLQNFDLLFVSSPNTEILVYPNDSNILPYFPGLFYAWKGGNRIGVSFWSWRFIFGIREIDPRHRWFYFYLFKRKGSTATELSIGNRHNNIKHITYDYFSHLDDEHASHALLPFTMQQVQYILLPKFQNDERPVRKTKILFSGNSREISYNNHLIRDKFGILNRHEIIDFLKRTYKKDQRVSFTIKDWKPIWILDFSWSVEKSNRIENKLMGDSYLSVLSQSDFFLCCPGVNMPFCFHTIEAMACGVIPILQYPHLLRPQLRNGENCFSFESTAELKEIIESIMKMEPAEIQKMRREVILYYSRFLSAESIRERMLDQSFSTYYFPVNKISADLFNLPNASS